MGDFDSHVEALANQIERQAELNAEREEARARSREPMVSAEERAERAERDERLKALGLARANLVAQMKVASSDRFREYLARSLATIDADIAALDQ